MDRTNQLLLGTAAILILLTAGRIWQESQPPAPLWTLAPVSPSDVTAVSLTAPGGSVRIERAADGWRLVEPVARVADRSKVQDLLRDWSDGFEADLKLVERPTAEELASFELDEARRTTLRLEGTPVALRLGRPVSGGSHFVQSAAGGPVFRGRVPGAFRLQGDEGAWRDRRLFPFAKDDLSALVLEGTHGRFAFERVETPERAWWRAGPGTEFEPSSRTLDSMGRSLANLEALRILEGPEALEARAAAALDLPVLQATATTRGGEAYTLRFGAEAEGGRYADLLGDERVFVVPGATWRVFDKDEAALLDKTVVRFERAPGHRIALRSEGGEVIVEPVGEREWRLKAPPGADLDSRELNLAANSLLNLQASEILAAAPDGEHIASLLVDTAEGEVTLRLTRDGERVIAEVDGRSGAYLLRGAVMERLLRLLDVLAP